MLLRNHVGRYIVVVGVVGLMCWTSARGLSPKTPAEEPISVVTTIPVLKDLVQTIGRSHIHVISLLSGLENEHSYSPKPSDLVAVRKARMLVEIGAGLEVWAAGLIRNAGNRDLTVVTTSRGIELIGPTSALSSSSASDLAEEHSTGNPHIWLDPVNVATMVRQITEALSRIDPRHAEEYARHQDAYLQELEQTAGSLTDRLQHLSDRRIVTHHPAWPYFARRFNFQIVGEIQQQSGSEPSPRHLQALIAHIRRDHIKVIVSEPQLNQKLPRILAEESGARLVVLTALPGGVPGTGTYLDMLRYNVLQLLEALDRP